MKKLITERFKELAGIKPLNEDEENIPFLLDKESAENLKYLTNLPLKGNEKIAELTGLANFILDTLKKNDTATIKKDF